MNDAIQESLGEVFTPAELAQMRRDVQYGRISFVTIVERRDRMLTRTRTKKELDLTILIATSEMQIRRKHINTDFRNCSDQNHSKALRNFKCAMCEISKAINAIELDLEERSRL